MQISTPSSLQLLTKTTSRALLSRPPKTQYPSIQTSGRQVTGSKQQDIFPITQNKTHFNKQHQWWSISFQRKNMMAERYSVQKTKRHTLTSFFQSSALCQLIGKDCSSCVSSQWKTKRGETECLFALILILYLYTGLGTDY